MPDCHLVLRTVTTCIVSPSSTNYQEAIRLLKPPCFLRLFPDSFVSPNLVMLEFKLASFRPLRAPASISPRPLLLVLNEA